MEPESTKQYPGSPSTLEEVEDTSVEEILMSTRTTQNLMVVDLEEGTTDAIDEITKISPDDYGSSEGPKDRSRLFEQPGAGISPISIKANSKKVKWIEYHYRYPPWPTTAKEGVLHIVDTSYLPQMSTRKQLHMDIEYGKEYRESREAFSCYFEQILGRPVQCNIQEFKCSGVRICSNASEQIKAYQHSQVNHQEWRRMLMTVQDRSLAQRPPFEGISKTEAYYTWLTQQYTNSRCHVHCRGYQIKQRQGSTQWIAICCNYGSSTSGIKPGTHFVHGIKHDINTQYLRTLVSGQQVIKSYDCNGVFARRSQRTTCGNSHPHESTQLVPRSCEVRMIALTPTDDSVPFVGLISHGVHMHPPIWSEKTPLEIRTELDQLLQWAGRNNYTFSQLRNSSVVKEWFVKWNANSFAGVHKSLSNPDRLRAIMYRNRAEAFPLGQDLAAVKVVYSGRLSLPPAQRWIQNVFECEDFFLICCFNQTQASIFKEAKTITLDTSFKRVLGNVSELTIVVKEDLGRNVSMTIPIARVFMSTETAATFYYAFTQLFNCLARANGQEVMFYHIHGYGIQTIVVDMDTKQASGFGQYLVDVAKSNKSWEWHIQHLFIYCLVHYNRGIEQKFVDHPRYESMRQLPYIEDSEDVMSILDDLKADPITSAWAQHKSTKWVLSGLNVNYTLMARGVFKSAHRTTNTVESMHQRGYLDGMRLPLLKAIYSAQTGDQDILDKRQAVLDGHALTYRNLSPGGAIQRSESRRGRMRTSEINDDPIPFPNLRSTGIIGRSASSSPEKRSRSESSGTLTIAPKRSKARLTQLQEEVELQVRINTALEQRLVLHQKMQDAGLKVEPGEGS